eukprot:TRINITY_DN1529_c0_g1_i2.p1 TRINITY_DN1529_c0_g1~~TRINITY_DN1529_c0_g1_i2.p1  ORF type:complete len:311 (+),score=78.73 TRINITY_DN1529_c0_g1_i2:87-1019(+)
MGNCQASPAGGKGRASAAVCHPAAHGCGPSRFTPAFDGSTKGAKPPGHQTCPGLPLLFPIPEGGRTIRYTLVLDVDECLVRAMDTCEMSPPTIFPRPGLSNFIRRLHGLLGKGLEVVLWTSASYAQAMLAWQSIDPCGTTVSQIVWRSNKWVMKDESGLLTDAATGIKMKCFKDLSLLGRDEKRTMLVDNAPQNLYTHQDHSVLIEDYYDPPAQQTDRSLDALGQLVAEMVDSDMDVPNFLEQRFQSRRMKCVRVSVPGLSPIKVKKLDLSQNIPAKEPPRAALVSPTEECGLTSSSPYDSQSSTASRVR